jgi:hypothetical protein
VVLHDVVGSERLVAGSNDGQIRIWDAEVAFKEIEALEASLTSRAPQDQNDGATLASKTLQPYKPITLTRHSRNQRKRNRLCVRLRQRRLCEDYTDTRHLTPDT